MKIAFLVERPTQFEAPFYRFAARDPEHELRVLFTGRDVAEPAFDPELGRPVSWGIDLLGGYPHEVCPPADAARWLAERLQPGRCDLLIANGYTQRALPAGRPDREAGRSAGRPAPRLRALGHLLLPQPRQAAPLRHLHETDVRPLPRHRQPDPRLPPRLRRPRASAPASSPTRWTWRASRERSRLRRRSARRSASGSASRPAPGSCWASPSSTTARRPGTSCGRSPGWPGRRLAGARRGRPRPPGARGLRPRARAVAGALPRLRPLPRAAGPLRGGGPVRPSRPRGALGGLRPGGARLRPAGGRLLPRGAAYDLIEAGGNGFMYPAGDDGCRRPRIGEALALRPARPRSETAGPRPLGLRRHLANLLDAVGRWASP